MVPVCFIIVAETTFLNQITIFQVQATIKVSYFCGSNLYSWLPNYKLVLTIGVHVLLRNIDKPGGLFNGTKIQAIRMGEPLTGAQIISIIKYC